MVKNPIVKILLLLLLALAAWGISEVFQTNSNHLIVDGNSANSNAIIDDRENTLSNNSHTHSSELDSTLTTVLAWINEGDIKQSLRWLQANRVSLSSAEIDSFKSAFYKHLQALIDADHFRQAKVHLVLFINEFDELSAWEYLSSVLTTLGEEQQAHNALMRAAALEFDSLKLAEKIRQLENSAHSLKTKFDANNNPYAKLRMYQDLYHQHSQSAVFAYELAVAHSALNQVQQAEQLLLPLIYDELLGKQAQQLLNSIYASQQANADARSPASQSNPNLDPIVVPLIRRGTGFLVNTKINGQPINLLLDTGASITALSAKAIEQLELKPTDANMVLSTANGVTTAPVFQANAIQLGALNITTPMVAQIDLGDGSGLDGLLGTDILTSVSSQYDYVIDNQQGALIFKPK